MVRDERPLLRASFAEQKAFKLRARADYPARRSYKSAKVGVARSSKVLSTCLQRVSAFVSALYSKHA